MRNIFCSYFPLLMSSMLLFSCKDSTKTPTIKVLKKELIVTSPSFASCHASSLVALPGNRILATWFAGTHESHPDVSIQTSRLEKGVWSSPVTVADGIINDSLRYPTWNPVLYQTSANKLALFYKVGPNPRTWWGEVKYSYDNGTTWSAPEKLPDGFLGPIKNKPVLLNNGQILYPSSTESEDEKTWSIHLETTDTLLQNWSKINIDNDTFGAIQPSILFYPGHRLQLLARSRQNYILESWSTDNGKTWSKLAKTELPNPNSGSDAVTLSNGWQLLVYNPMPAGKDWWNGRNKLSVALSKDGKTWTTNLQLEDQPDGEFSYPAVIQTGDGLVHITYTANRKNIQYVQLQLSE